MSSEVGTVVGSTVGNAVGKVVGGTIGNIIGGIVNGSVIGGIIGGASAFLFTIDTKNPYLIGGYTLARIAIGSYFGITGSIVGTLCGYGAGFVVGLFHYGGRGSKFPYIATTIVPILLAIIIGGFIGNGMERFALRLWHA